MTSVKEMSVYFVLSCALVGSSFAAPILGGLSDSQSLANASGSIQAVSSDSTENSIENQVMLSLYTSIVGSYAVELSSIADGSHFVVPLSKNTDRERVYKTVAIAVSKLLMNLKSMERTHNFIQNVTVELIFKTEFPNINDTESLEEMFRTFLNSYIEGIDNKLETDEELAAEYKKQKSISKQFVEHDPEVREPVFKVKDLFQDSPNDKKRRAFLQGHKIFCDAILTINSFLEAVRNDGAHFNSTGYRRNLMARALIQKAQSSDYESKVNEVYHNALVQVRPFLIELNVTSSIAIVSNALFDSIDTQLASDTTLQKEIEALMKQIADTQLESETTLKKKFEALMKQIADESGKRST